MAGLQRNSLRGVLARPAKLDEVRRLAPDSAKGTRQAGQPGHSQLIDRVYKTDTVASGT
jgi:hypothetical protein